MALDYSKLTEAELEAIANDDYSKLSDATLKALSADTGPPQGISLAQPQAAEYATAQVPAVAAGAARELMGGAATTNVRDAATIAKNATSWTPRSMVEVITQPLNTARAYVGGHPFADTPIRQIAGSVGKNIAGAAVTGLLGRENMFTLPYTMAAYEQEKIRANPTAPGLEYNPYAQTVRGEYPTQGAAGAANTRQAVANMPTGYQPTAQEAANLLASGDQRTIEMYGGAQRLAQAAAARSAQPAQESWMDRAMSISRKYRPQ